MARKALLAGGSDSDDESNDSGSNNSSESSSQGADVPFQMTFGSAFESVPKKQSDNHLESKKGDKIEWQFR